MPRVSYCKRRLKHAISAISQHCIGHCRASQTEDHRTTLYQEGCHPTGRKLSGVLVDDPQEGRGNARLWSLAQPATRRQFGLPEILSRPPPTLPASLRSLSLSLSKIVNTSLTSRRSIPRQGGGCGGSDDGSRLPPSFVRGPRVPTMVLPSTYSCPCSVCRRHQRIMLRALTSAPPTACLHLISCSMAS